MKVVIDRDLCQGHAVCMGEAPEVFEVDEEGNNTQLLMAVTGDLIEKVELAARYCPNQAIALADEK